MASLGSQDIADLLQKPVSELPGVAGKRAELLSKLDIATWYDLLTWFPRDYEDWSELSSPLELEDGKTGLLRAVVSRKPALQRKGRLTILRTQITDRADRYDVVWFNQPWLADRLVVGQVYIFRGKIKKQSRRTSLQNPDFERLDLESAEEQSGGIRPVYALTAGITQGVMRQLIRVLLRQLNAPLPEPIPAAVRHRYHLCAMDYAYHRIHNPASWQEAEVCRHRLAFEELFLLQAGLFLLRQADEHKKPAFKVRPDSTACERIELVIRQLPFTLTSAQQQAWEQIRRDLAGPVPMNRLLQGDVGSGKTVVAALAMLQCALAGYQAVMMAPTAVLARQHEQTLRQLLQGSGLSIGLLTGSTPAARRRQLLNDLAEGKLKLLVGTHALIEERVCFHQLALAVTDEQHRFGVRQRIRLSSGDSGDLQPHVMVMSATPIPRTLALMLYGDLDITVIDQLPAGRKPIRTYTATSADRSRLDSLIQRQIAQGRQVYVVCPMIAESEEIDLESAIATYQRLAGQVVLQEIAGLLHGQMKAKEKETLMDQFLDGKIKLLVSTTVIEVGVDNPNASLMLIENAERFGLAQLHQLRGRIGRGEHESICVLISDSQDELARSRLRALCQSTDGFVLAEKDLELRGPGDFFGTRQHGLPPLRVANLYQDIGLMQQARDSLQAIVREDPGLREPPHQLIRQTLQSRYGEIFAAIGI